jgi:hypothetical protein
MAGVEAGSTRPLTGLGSPTEQLSRALTAPIRVLYLFRLVSVATPLFSDRQL